MTIKYSYFFGLKKIKYKNAIRRKNRAYTSNNYYIRINAISKNIVSKYFCLIVYFNDLAGWKCNQILIVENGREIK